MSPYRNRFKAAYLLLGIAAISSLVSAYLLASPTPRAYYPSQPFKLVDSRSGYALLVRTPPGFKSETDNNGNLSLSYQEQNCLSGSLQVFSARGQNPLKIARRFMGYSLGRDFSPGRLWEAKVKLPFKGRMLPGRLVSDSDQGRAIQAIRLPRSKYQLVVAFHLMAKKGCSEGALKAKASQLERMVVKARVVKAG